MATASSRWRLLRLGVPTRRWFGISTPCAAATLALRNLMLPTTRLHRSNTVWGIAFIFARRMSMIFTSGPVRSGYITCTDRSTNRDAWRATNRSRIRLCTKRSISSQPATRCGKAVRPHIVWFGEIPLDMEGIYNQLSRATQFLVIGTSGSVYPAAGLVQVAVQRGIRTVYVGPEEPLNATAFDEILLGPATQVLPGLL